jgi:replicative DNA helicase
MRPADRPISPAEALVARIDARDPGRPVPPPTPAGETIVTGFPSIDRQLGGGFRRQDLVVLAGDVGAGKSALALGIALRSARAGTPVLYLSGEMSEERLFERALALEARLPVDALRHGDLDELTRASVGAAAIRLRDLPLIVRPLPHDPRLLDEALRTVPRRALCVIDELQLVQPLVVGETPEQSLASTARRLKQMALDEELAILAVAQLPRLRPGRLDPRPTLDDLGGGGVVKQVADVVLALYREEMYRPGVGVEGAVELIVGKNRNGPTGYLDLYFYRQWLRFEDMLDPDR